MKCHCGNDAVVQIEWTISKGQQNGNFCQKCADDFWSRFKHTPAGQGATFKEVK